MARVGGEWGFKGRRIWGFSYKKTTLLVCSINIVVALYVLRSLYGSLYIYSDRDTRPTFEYTPDQIRKMEESVRIRKAAEPVELIRLVKALKKELYREVAVELPQPLKLKMTNDIIDRLKTLRPNANITEQREVVERWCKEKLKEAKQLAVETKASNSTVLHEEAEMLVKALESDSTWLLEDLGLWIPPEIRNTEHHDKPEGEEEELDDQILPGRPLPPECHAEVHTDYDGAAVRWGLTHHKDSAADCCQACFDQAKRAKPNEKRCNIWVYCPSETGCHSPDIYEHKLGECWLKYAETPKLNFKDKYPESYRNRHPSAPLVVPWASGIVGAR
ncbi:hypothetical protein ACFX2I_016728 [Malus domestica]|uniref:uncharacterized protein LOC126605054 n=1 Tax=Malus sylvestris TaxID=3752 RepID=UPI0021AC061E|nr:uncharacterized protein LOC126605054 [Malus sylvestris]